MSRFGLAYVNDVITGSGGITNPGGSDKQIQFNSGSTFSGSTNFTFDYTTNTVRLTGTLYADSLIVSSSVIYTSGSTKFGDDTGDTHQFTGSIYNTTLVSGTIARFTTVTGSNLVAGIITATSNIVSTGGILSASTGVQTAGAITAVTNITSTGGILSASAGVQTGGAITAGTSITSTGGILSSSTGVQSGGSITSQGILSSSLGVQTNSTITARNNITSTSGLISASSGLYSGDVLNIAGSSTLRSGLTVTGSSFVQALSSSGQIQATSFAGNGLNIIGVQATNVDGAGDDWAVQFKSGDTGTLTGSSNLLFSGSTLTLTGSGIASFGTVSGSTVTGSTALFTTITASVVSASSYVGPIPKHAVFAASGITTGSFYERRTINANKYLQLQRRKTFPIARSIGASDSEYGWLWLNRSSLSGSSDENVTVVSGANFVHSQSSNTTWFNPNFTAPVRYKSYGLMPGQTLQVIAKIAATGSQDFESTQILAWVSGSNTQYVRTGPAYDTGIKLATQYAGTSTNVSLTSAERASGVWVNLTLTEDTFVLYHYTGSSGLTPPTSGWEFNVCSTFASSTTYGKKLNIGQMIMSGRAGSNNATGSFLYYDVSITDQTDYINPIPYVRWGATQYDTSGTEQLIGEFDLGSSSTVNQTVLRQVLADLENNIEGDTATVTWSAVQSNSSGASSSTFYASNAVVISGSGRYFRLWVKITSNGNQPGSVGPFPIVIPIS